MKYASFYLFPFMLYCSLVYGHTLGNVEAFKDTGRGIKLQCSNAILSIEVIAPDIIRVRLGINLKFLDDYSYSLREDVSPQRTDYKAFDKSSSIVLTTHALDVLVDKANASIGFYDKSGFNICQDFSPVSWEIAEEGYSVTCTKTLSYDDHFYGLGEKSGGLDKRRSLFEMWNTDAYGYGPSTDPLYQSHPFFIGLKDGKAFGVFFDNTYRTFFDFGYQFEDRYGFQSQGGELDYYFIQGPKIKDVVHRYANLTGTTPLPPMWALGHMLCRHSYYPDSEVLKIAKNARSKLIPLDVIWLDIHYMDDFKVFTWDKKLFPNLKGLTSKMHDMGIKVVSMINPGVKADPSYDVFRSGVEKDMFLKYSDGGLYIGEVWPGNCVFPDFSDPGVRDWWGKLYQKLIDEGIDGFWNDMNEPAIFGVESKTMDDNVMFYDYGLYSTHKKMHNVFALNMLKATFEGVSKLMDNERSFVLTRAGFSGIQKYGASWTGDNSSSFEHLGLQIPMLLNMGLSGTPFVGSDIGGYAGSPTPELLTRWYQASALVPLMREHTSITTYDQEPWVYGEPYTSIIRKSINMRYELLPYIYTLFYKTSKDGSPILRPLVYEYQKDRNTWTIHDEFLVGSDILVAPALKEETLGRYVYFPDGNWYDYDTKGVFEGGKSFYIHTPLETTPVFIKEGSVITKKELGQYTTEHPMDTLTLEIYPLISNNASVSILYLDDGRSRNTAYSLFSFDMNNKNDGFGISIEKTGSYDLTKCFNIKIFSRSPKEITFGKTPIPFNYANGVVLFKIKAKKGKMVIKY